MNACAEAVFVKHPVVLTPMTTPVPKTGGPVNAPETDVVRHGRIDQFIELFKTDSPQHFAVFIRIRSNVTARKRVNIQVIRPRIRLRQMHVCDGMEQGSPFKFSSERRSSTD